MLPAVREEPHVLLACGPHLARDETEEWLDDCSERLVSAVGCFVEGVSGHGENPRWQTPIYLDLPFGIPEN